MGKNLETILNLEHSLPPNEQANYLHQIQIHDPNGNQAMFHPNRLAL